MSAKQGFGNTLSRYLEGQRKTLKIFIIVTGISIGNRTVYLLNTKQEL